MGKRVQRQAWVLLIVLTGAIIAGCESTPVVDPPPIVGTADLNSPQAQADAAHLYWKRYNVPDMRPYNYKRIAISEFAVEFVTRKRQGDGEKKFLYPQFLYNSLPTELYDQFCDKMKKQGLEIVDKRLVRHSRAYARFEMLNNGHKPSGNSLRDNTSDTGRVKEITIYSADGLKILGGAGGVDMEVVEAEMLDEINADVILRIRIRVGVFDGHATLDRGSRIWVLSKDVAGNLAADRSLISDAWVLNEEKGSPIRIFLPRYQNAVREMFPPFIEMALLSADSAYKPE